MLDWNSIPPFSLLLLMMGGLFVWIGYDLKMDARRKIARAKNHSDPKKA